MISSIIKSICLISLSCTFSLGYAQTEDMNINELMAETQFFSEDMNSLSMAWWVPIEFWQLSFQDDPYTSEAIAEEYVKLLSPYNMIVVSDGYMGLFAGNYKSKNEIRNSTKLIDGKGNIYEPIPEEDLSLDIKLFIETIKPFFTSMMGEMGENMHVLVFPKSAYNGVDIINPREEGAFTIRVGEEDFYWATPIGAFLPPKMCPEDNERLSGGWKYCPIHGKELVLYEDKKKKKK